MPEKVARLRELRGCAVRAERLLLQGAQSVRVHLDVRAGEDMQVGDTYKTESGTYESQHVIEKEWHHGFLCNAHYMVFRRISGGVV